MTLLFTTLPRPTAENITLAFLVLSNAIAVVIWYTTSMRKRFASETEWKKTIQNQKEIYKLISELNTSIKDLKETVESHEDEAYRRYSEGVNRIDKELVEVKSSIQTLTFALRPHQPPTSGWGKNE